MAEELVCGGNWPWNSSRNFFSSSPCSLATTNDVVGWPYHDVILTDDTKSARSSDDSATSAASQELPTNGFDVMGWNNQDLLSESYSNFQMNSNINYDDQQSKPQNTFNSSLINNTCFPDLSTSTDHSIGFPLNSASYNYTSSLIQTLFDTDSQPQQPLLDYSSTNSNGFLSNLPKPSPMLNPQPNSSLPNAPLWNVDLSNGPSTFAQSHHFLPSTLNNKRPNHPNFGAKHQHEEGKAVGKKSSNEAAAFKRPRIETPSPLPTFKVRKEKLGDRITALQQLVSPFGKTDTASVLHEAIEYIKFLHDQVNALSTPYLKYGSPPLQRQQGGDKTKDGEGLHKDLNSRGLCLVPISSTFPVAAETPSDFWTPTFAANLK